MTNYKARLCCNCLNYAHGACRGGLNPSLADNPPPMPQRWAGEFVPDHMAAFCDSYLWAPEGYTRLRYYCASSGGKHRDFTTAGLAVKFAGFYEQGMKVRIRVQYMELGPVHRGYVSISRGWAPCFLLVRSTRARGGMPLSDVYRIIGVREEGKRNYAHYHEQE